MGSVYKITDGEKCYYGSTINPLYVRFSKHKNTIECKTYELNTDNITIELVEEVEDEEQLLWRERYYIENNECVNKVIPIRTDDERKQQQTKPYYCACGSVITNRHKARHFKSKKHLSICGEE